MNTVYAKEYQIRPDTEECQIDRVAAMLSQNPSDTCFVFEPGKYHFYQENTQKRSFAVSNSDQAEYLKIAVLMEQMNDIILDGQGAEFIYHGDMIPLAVSECHHVEVKNITFDSAVPFSAEAKVLESRENEIEIYINHEIFPYHIEDETLVFERGCGQEAPMFAAMEFDAESGRIPAGAGDTFPDVEAYAVEENVVRLKGDFQVLPQVGNILVIRHGKRVHPGGLIQYSDHIRLENVVYHQTCGLGVVFQFNENISVSHVEFCPNRKRGIRITSGHDDGLHFSNNRGQITVENCRFSGLMDDPINVHGTAACITEKCGKNVLRCEYRHPQSIGFNRWAVKGDQIGWIDHRNRECYGTGTVAEYRLLSPTEFELHFEEPVCEKIRIGDAVENLTNTPSLICRNTYFGSTRARGLLVTTPKPVVIEQNVFESSGSAVTITGDVNDWYESGTCTDVLIRGNKFLDCCTSKYQFSEAVIHIEPGVEPEQKAMVHRNIRVVDNEFLLSKAGVLYADHTGDILMENNRFIVKNDSPLQMMILNHCDNVCLQKNIQRGNENGQKT